MTRPNAKTVIYCTGQLEGGTSFAIRADTGESIFVSSTIAINGGMHLGSSHLATLIPNAREPERTPWFAVFVDKPSDDVDNTDVRADDAPNDPPKMSPIEKFMKGFSGYLTTDEVADECDMSVEPAKVELEKLFLDGKITRAQVSCRDGETSDVYLWGRDMNVFVE